jgi:dGTPase
MGQNQPGPYERYGPYREPDMERYVPEPDKRPGRTAFQRDRARVLHSAALRRLAGKTQVVDPGVSVAAATDTSPRTRLTHSLECAQVGRELGAALGCDPDLVETACLAHDLGHPPFGHNGELVLAEFAAACGGFEGNAQSLRLLTRIEPKRFVPVAGAGSGPGSAKGTGTGAGSGGATGTGLGPATDPADLGIDPRTHPGGATLVSVGLNHTRAALDAATKYPWPRGGHPTESGSPKFGVYEDDLPVFRWLRQGAPEGRICFEAQVMDWADDVAYSVHDVEDGLQAGHIDPRALLSGPERDEVFGCAADRYAPAGTDPAELAAALDRLLAQPWWPRRYDGSALDQARLKDAASQLIGRFCLAAEGATRARYGTARLTRYGAELVVPREQRLECAVLKAVADRYVMQRAAQERRRAEQRIVIGELAHTLLEGAPEGLDPQFRAIFEAAADDSGRRRAVVDQIASLTDAAATALHARLTHRRIPR